MFIASAPDPNFLAGLKQIPSKKCIVMPQIMEGTIFRSLANMRHERDRIDHYQQSNAS